ncbi:hypothetical protein Sjap_020924 [Stephania japonica]|uniref:Uncharacterized protein n=1 Tax=Stephania japonica TaxID=461633 RepID=A0AAP0F4B1_9MAGN
MILAGPSSSPLSASGCRLTGAVLKLLLLLESLTFRLVEDIFCHENKIQINVFNYILY